MKRVPGLRPLSFRNTLFTNVTVCTLLVFSMLTSFLFPFFQAKSPLRFYLVSQKELFYLTRSEKCIF